MTTSVARTSGVGRLGSRRLAGVDAARGLALLGMMAAHLLDPDTLLLAGVDAHVVVDGRSSATFAVLAGAGLALADGGCEGPRTGYRHMVARTAVRAGVVLAIGLLLAGSGANVAVILQYYALLFLAVAPVLRLRPWLLLALGGVWLLVGPVLSHLLRASLGVAGPNAQVDVLVLLTDPLGAVLELTLTGYYPVLTWFAYLLVGAGIGRLALDRTRTALGILTAGAVLATAAPLVSGLLLRAGGAVAIDAAPDLLNGRSPDGPFYGTTPTSSWWWLVLDDPHSGTPLDLLGTTGSALLVVGACLLLARHVTRWALLPLAAAGSMTLTLYTVHVVVLALDLPRLGPVASWWVHVILALLFATLWRSTFRRGPLETLAADVVDGAAGAVPARRDTLSPGSIG